MGRIVFGMKWGDEWVEGRRENVGSVRSAFVRIDAEVASTGVLGEGEQWSWCEKFVGISVTPTWRSMDVSWKGGLWGCQFLAHRPLGWLVVLFVEAAGTWRGWRVRKKSMSSLSMWLRLLILTMDWVTVVTVFSLLVVFQTFQAESTTC